MKRISLFLALVLMPQNMLNAAETKGIPLASTLRYADVADLAIDAPLALEVRIRKATKITRKQAPNTPPGHQRYLIEADVLAAIRAAEDVPPRIGWLYDATRDSGGKLPKLAKARLIVFGLPVANRPGWLQLATPDSQIPSNPTDAARVRAILKEALSADAPPVVTGVGNAFHVAGTLEGEGESQIFLTTSDGRPISFNIVRARGQQPSWSVSIDEIVDANAARPRPDTLLWYRLACFLPATLPPASLAGQEGEDGRILAADYRTAMTGLGPCPRNRAR